ncbi:MAG TPA: hypothetical protein DC000_10770 [Clostridiales bacterium]|nr:hypothetical protein [Clostridiales bacterium]
MINLDEFKNVLNDKNLKEMAKLNMPLEWAYKEYQNLLNENTGETIEVNKGIETIINDYINGLLYKEFNRYELDWE